MHQNNPVLNTLMAKQLATAEAALGSYQRSREDWQSKAALTVQHQQAAEAAETNAKSLKQQARNLLHSMIGKPPPKQMTALRSEERAAYSLAEDYHFLASELELARDETEISMLETGKAYMDARDLALETLAEERMQAALAQLDNLLSAMALRRMVLNQPYHTAIWKDRGFDSALDVLMAEVHKQLKQQLECFTLNVSQEPVLQALPYEDGLNEARAISPIQLQRRRTALTQRQQEHAA